MVLPQSLLQLRAGLVIKHVGSGVGLSELESQISHYAIPDNLLNFLMFLFPHL